MDKAIKFREADTNMLEIKKIVHCLVTNGYEFEGTREADDGRVSYPDDAIADFSKDLDYTDVVGNYINDSKLKVSIHFEKRADYTKFEKNKNEDKDDIYVGNPYNFISELIEEIQDSSSARGGAKRKKRKTRKIRKCKK